ncbi:hypothetical protein HPB47_021842 [Ixodes persulcatus]|uniref:Uncharacterized protein n=1 Tax=Ixodes persulcatus TaxID=34615 RepID=A0AC60QCE2_IXOPE|nr:hypothetical protein HPB47_021842 [Ixodes persulcatus]
MEDHLAKQRAVRHQNNALLYDAQLPFQLPDGTLSFKDFIGNCNNRITNPEAASTNRIQPPASSQPPPPLPPTTREDSHGARGQRRGGGVESLWVLRPTARKKNSSSAPGAQRAREPCSRLGARESVGCHQKVKVCFSEIRLVGPSCG